MGNIIKIQDILENKVSLDDARSKVILHNNEMFSYFDEGLTRYVYRNSDNTKVIKLEKSERGTNWNEKEINIYENASDEKKEQMAKTEFINGFIEQEFCMPIKFAGKKLTIPQRLFASSCRNEVGWNSNDVLVCFDLDEFKKY